MSESKTEHQPHKNFGTSPFGIEAMTVLLQTRSATPEQRQHIKIPNDETRFEVFNYLFSQLDILREQGNSATSNDEFATKFPVETGVIEVLYHDPIEQQVMIGECMRFLNTQPAPHRN